MSPVGPVLSVSKFYEDRGTYVIGLWDISCRNFKPKRPEEAIEIFLLQIALHLVTWCCKQWALLPWRIVKQSGSRWFIRRWCSVVVTSVSTKYGGRNCFWKAVQTMSLLRISERLWWYYEMVLERRQAWVSGAPGPEHSPRACCSLDGKGTPVDLWSISYQEGLWIQLLVQYICVIRPEEFYFHSRCILWGMKEDLSISWYDEVCRWWYVKGKINTLRISFHVLEKNAFNCLELTFHSFLTHIQDRRITLELLVRQKIHSGRAGWVALSCCFRLGMVVHVTLETSTPDESNSNFWAGK